MKAERVLRDKTAQAGVGIPVVGLSEWPASQSTAEERELMETDDRIRKLEKKIRKLTTKPAKAVELSEYDE
jgi:hypothetical protein